MPKRNVEELRYTLLARATLIRILTQEERAAERDAAEVAETCGYRARYWDCARGASDVQGKPVPVQDPALALPGVLAQIRKRTQPECWVLRDVAPFLRDPRITRALKSLALDLQDETDANRLASIVLIGAADEYPVELEALTHTIEWPLPDAEEIRGYIREVQEATAVAIEGGSEDALVEAAAGLTAEDASSAFARSIAEHGTLRVAAVHSQKRAIVNRSRVVQWYDPPPGGLDNLGGLDALKSQLVEWGGAFSPAAQEYGIRPPRAVLLAGVPGCGKSETAKCLGSEWGVPTLRVDLGALKGGIVGKSEENIRRMWAVARAVRRCNVWIDEGEKSALGSGGRELDGGVSSDQLGFLLSALEDTLEPVFMVMTANRADRLPPEMLNRFTGIFFADLPTEEERASILRAVTARFGRGLEDIEVAPAVAPMREFNGREIRRAYEGAMLAAFRDGARPVRTEDVIHAARAVVPAASVSRTEIEALRTWAAGRATAASSLTASQSTGGGTAPVGGGRFAVIPMGGSN